VVAAGSAARLHAGIEQPLNLIVCENLKGAAALFRGMVCEHLNESERAYLSTHVGFVDTVIGRMVPELTPELRALDRTLVIAEPYKELPVDRAGFIGPIPDIVGMEPCDNFPLYTARKLYLHNAGHAVLAYLGYRRHYQLGYEALEDREIRPILDAALEESLLGIVARYQANEVWLRTHVNDLKERFANRVLADPVLRLGRDPLRKLAPDDRLVGAARTAETTGHTPSNLAWAIAAGLAFDAPGDDKALEMQKRITREGLAAVMEGVCSIKRDEPLGQAILERYSQLHHENRWQ
jgi:mannitol-1-phosphate 5-dehydrogenase